MTMDSKTTEQNISFEKSEELEKKWAEETAKEKIVKEACIRVAITEDGYSLSSVDIEDADLFSAVMVSINNVNPAAFAAVTAEIALKKLTKGFSDFFNELAESTNDTSDSESEDGEMEETPE